MLLMSLLENVEYEQIKGTLQVEVESITYDSRDVTSNSLFVAIKGYTTDGHRYLQQAIDNGASVVMVEEDVIVTEDVTVLRAKDTRKALACLSANYYHHPTANLNLIGITGTNGKTSTTYFLKSIFDVQKHSTGIIGTIGTIIDGKLIKTDNTTPESTILQETFREMVTADTENCIMEVSSHALALDRVLYSQFNTGVFTNLTPDHLELHKNMEEYFNAKSKLFFQTHDHNIINVDDEYGRKLMDRVQNRVNMLTYGIHNDADIYATDIEYTITGTTYTVVTPAGNERIQVNLPGEIYVYNTLAAIACAYVNGIDLEVTARGIENVDGIKGRFEVVYAKDDFRVIVDFAHTEDALQKTLEIVRPFVKGRLILVFGVYADESNEGHEKRLGMSKVASAYADYAFVTLDNPKHHDQQIMMQDIEQAMNQYHGHFDMIFDREQAIQAAINTADETDMIVIAGKGHETTQIIGDVEIPFNEAEIVQEAMQHKIHGQVQV